MSEFDDGVRIGLKRPKELEEQLAIQEDIRAMRKAITFGQRDSALISRCLRVAEHAGLSSEETMVLLAYNSLCHVEELFKHQLKLAMLDIRAPRVMGSPDNQFGDPK